MEREELRKACHLFLKLLEATEFKVCSLSPQNFSTLINHLFKTYGLKDIRLHHMAISTQGLKKILEKKLTGDCLCHIWEERTSITEPQNSATLRMTFIQTQKTTSDSSKKCG